MEKNKSGKNDPGRRRFHFWALGPLWGAAPRCEDSSKNKSRHFAVLVSILKHFSNQIIVIFWPNHVVILPDQIIVILPCLDLRCPSGAKVSEPLCHSTIWGWKATDTRSETARSIGWCAWAGWPNIWFFETCVFRCWKDAPRREL